MEVLANGSKGMKVKGMKVKGMKVKGIKVSRQPSFRDAAIPLQ